MPDLYEVAFLYNVHLKYLAPILGVYFIKIVGGVDPDPWIACRITGEGEFGFCFGSPSGEVMMYYAEQEKAGYPEERQRQSGGSPA